ncbi:MAG TPA: MBOAT family protein [Usitatibacteraceae bacterium]|nr:MBOAT family protein [Usitatibacteraceae bacterium]
MLFNSYGYLFLFLPIALAGYFALQRHSTLALAWLTAASLFFYAWWNPWHLPLVAGSIIFNFWVGRVLLQRPPGRRRGWLVFGVVANLVMLGVYKYLAFGASIAAGLGIALSVPALALPLGISFFTFTQIAYLVDTAKGEVRETHPVHYALFVTFFPHLLAGPIIHHREMMPQFAETAGRRFDAGNFARGLFLLAIGLAKKTMIADPLGEHANAGFAAVSGLDWAGAWATTLSYTFQIYFDFSGYTDMALGAALMFNIRLPVNFNSPYLARNIREFWRNWHMTLSRFLRDYVYLPLGGNRLGRAREAGNLMATFVLGGLWHGAGWTFIVWGALHGLALVIHRLWLRSGIVLPRVAAIALTFLFVHTTWVFFRAANLADAFTLIGKLLPAAADLRAFAAAAALPAPGLPFAAPPLPLLMMIAALLAMLPWNSNRLCERFRARPWQGLATGVLLAASVLTLGRATQFLYFNF